MKFRYSLTSLIQRRIAPLLSPEYTQCYKVERRSTVQQNAKELAVQVNNTLNDLGVPTNNRERASILSKMLDITKQQAWGLLEGNIFLDNILLKKIASELDIDYTVL